MKPACNKRKVKYWLFHSSDILSPHVSSDTLPHLWIHTNRGHPTRLRLCNPVFLSLRLVNWSWSKGWEVFPTPSNRLLHFPYCPLTTVSLILRFTSGHRPTKHSQISSITELPLKWKIWENPGFWSSWSIWWWYICPAVSDKMVQRSETKFSFCFGKLSIGSASSMLSGT